MDHSTFDEQLADLDNPGDLPSGLAEHAAVCARCSQRLALMQRVHETARLIEPIDTDMADRVLQRTHRPTRSRPALLAVAAAAVLIVGGAAIAVNRTSNEADVLADIADEYRQSDGIRFVYATEANVDIVDQFQLATDTSTDVQPISTRIPTCDDTDAPPVTGLDLQPIVDALTSDDPCLALQLIDESARPARDAYVALATSIDQRANIINQLENREIERGLDSASAAAYIADQTETIRTDSQTIEQLERSFSEIARTLEPLANPGSSEQVATSTIESRLVALRADTTAAEAAAASLPVTIGWTQIATGTWSTNGIDIDGITERNNNSTRYSRVDGDPLKLADVVLAQPDILIDLMRSAPSSNGDLVEWAVPTGFLGDTEDWRATARLQDGALASITLTSRNAIITFTPEQ